MHVVIRRNCTPFLVSRWQTSNFQHWMLLNLCQPDLKAHYSSPLHSQTVSRSLPSPFCIPPRPYAPRGQTTRGLQMFPITGWAAPGTKPSTWRARSNTCGPHGQPPLSPHPVKGSSPAAAHQTPHTFPESLGVQGPLPHCVVRVPARCAEARIWLGNYQVTQTAVYKYCHV